MEPIQGRLRTLVATVEDQDTGTDSDTRELLENTIDRTESTLIKNDVI